MEIFVHEGYSKAKLAKINRCRLYLGALTLSDVMNGYGNGFTTAYQCNRDTTRQSLFNWPKQEKPEAQTIKVWKSALQNTFGLQHGITEYTLGKWFYKFSNQWIWLYSPSTHIFYQQFGQVWRMWQRLHRQGRLGVSPCFCYTSNCIHLPDLVFWCTVKLIHQNVVQITGWNDHYFHEDPLLNLSSLEDWIISSIEKDINLNASLALAITRSEVQIVLDGSFYKEHCAGGAGWFIESLDRSISTSSSCIYPGPASAQSSPRSKLMGILGSLMHCNYICSRFDINSGNIHLYCDSESAIKTLNNNHSIIKNSRKNFDMLQSIHYAWQLSPLLWTFHHIKGHQDDLIAYNDLSRQHQRNVLADLKAKEVVINAIDNNTLNEFRLWSLPFIKCEVRIEPTSGKQQQVYSHLQKSIKEHCSTVHIREFWIQKHQLQHQQFKLDWELKRTSHRNSTKSRNRWLSKHSTGFCGVGKILRRYNYQSHSTCPRCGEPQETTAHVLQCKDESACILWGKEIDKLKNWMLSNKVNPTLCHQIIANLNAWKYKTPKNHHLPQHQILWKAILHQDQIGWKQFIEGFWSQYWRECQTLHLNNIQSPKSSILLLSKVQRCKWKIAWDMWEHRNNHLHSGKSSIPEVERQAINDEVTNEWNIGISALPAHHQHLFRGTLQEKLRKVTITKEFGLHQSGQPEKPQILII